LWDYGGGSREHEEVLGEEEGDDGQADTQAVEPDPDAPLDSDSQEEEARKKGKKRGVPNWAPAEAVACVWAQIARSDEQIQPLTELRKGAMKRRMSKAQELKRQGRWQDHLCGGRTPNQSAEIRAGPDCSPASFGVRQTR